MPRSTIDIAAEALGNVLPMLTSMVRVVGSAAGSEGTVRLVIEGNAVPDVPQVMCTMSRTDGPGKFIFEAVFKPVE